MKKTWTALALLVAIAAPAPAAAYTRDVDIAYIQRLDWESDYPQCMDCFVAHSALPGDWTVHHEAVDLALLVSGEQSIIGYDLGIVTGHVYYSFTDAERLILEEFVTLGGTLWFDDCADVEVDNLPFGMEIDFGSGTYAYWGTCFGDYFTFHDPDHELFSAVYAITPSIMRTDVMTPPNVLDATFFTPFVSHDAAYTLLVSGQSVGTYTFSGPAIIAARAGAGKIVATAMDMTCAMECVTYGDGEHPLSDYYFLINMLGWHDGDSDGMWDSDEGAFDAVEADTDADTMPDATDVDSDGDTVLDFVEAGDSDPDTPAADTDGDTVPDFRDADSDGDGIPDMVEETVDSDGDGFPEADADGDSIPNRLDSDSDGDGEPDLEEGTADPDGDAIPAFVDADETIEEPAEDAPADAPPDSPPDGAADGMPDPAVDPGPDPIIDASVDGACDEAACDGGCRDAGFASGACVVDTCTCTYDPGQPARSGGCGCTVVR